MPNRRFNRREFMAKTLRWAAVPLVGGGLSSLLAGCAPSPAPASGGQHAISATPSAARTPDLEVELTAAPGEVQLLPGAPTGVWRYSGRVLKGDPASLEQIPGSYLGPTFRVKHGQWVRIHFVNQLPETSVVHWHGLLVPEAMDGHPMHAVGPGRTYTYEFEIRNRAGTYWYHPHPHGLTGPQVYNGLAGLFIVSDDEERTAGLPEGAYDVPLVLQDRTLNRDNQLMYLTGGMMDRMMGFYGDRILVNGQPDFVLPVEARPYRLRLLNGSNARIYKLGWEDGSPLTVIATDGGLLSKPTLRPYVTLAPAERAELWVDFTGRAPGSELRLQSLAFEGTGNGGVHGAAELTEGSEYTVLRVRVTSGSTSHPVLQARLSSIQQLAPEDAHNAANPRTFSLEMRGMLWTINGRTFEMKAVARDEEVALGATEVWEFVNRPGHMGMMAEEMAHPIHLHGVQFQVLERQVSPGYAAAWDSVRGGYVDDGWKDTVLVMPGERVRLIARFGEYPGLFLYHCHNLEHEDLGMMRNLRITAA